MGVVLFAPQRVDGIQFGCTGERAAGKKIRPMTMQKLRGGGNRRDARLPPASPMNPEISLAAGVAADDARQAADAGQHRRLGQGLARNPAALLRVCWKKKSRANTKNERKSNGENVDKKQAGRQNAHRFSPFCRGIKKSGKTHHKTFRRKWGAHALCAASFHFFASRSHPFARGTAQNRDSAPSFRMLCAQFSPFPRGIHLRNLCWSDADKTRGGTVFLRRSDFPLLPRHQKKRQNAS